MPKPIVIDTDIFSDVDDVGALAVANVLHNCGMADLRAVLINTSSKYGSLAANAINTYFGNGNVPIGAMRPLTNDTFFDSRDFTLGEYASKVAYHYPTTFNDSHQTAHPVSLYREILASADDQSVTLISIGFLDNLAALLNSTSDVHSSLPGPELVNQKVRELVVMGGGYPSGWEWNFRGQNPLSTHLTINNWPGPITFSGISPGNTIYSGSRLKTDAPSDSPVLAAYQWYVGRGATSRESWDPLTTLYGILGLHGFAALGLRNLFEYANTFGYNHVSANGSNQWVNDTAVTNQHWLKLADGVSESSVSWLLDQLYCANPIQKSCFGFSLQSHLYNSVSNWPNFIDL